MDAIERLRIVVLTYVVGFPLGGMTWHSLQYALGLADLGHDVWALEDANDWDNCYDPTTGEVSTDPAYGLRYATDVYDRVGLGDRWAYYRTDADTWLGPAADRVLDICANADVVLNIASMHPMRPWLLQIPHRVQIDTDPAFTQIRNLTQPGFGALAAQHTAHFSFGERIALGDAAVPDDGIAWLPTRQPVHLPAWSVTPGDAHARFTTVMQWDSYATREWGGVTYGMKSASFTPYLDLPKQVEAPLELALGRYERSAADRLAAAGWVLSDAQLATWDPWVYQDYIRGSAAEFSVAKQGYAAEWGGLTYGMKSASFTPYLDLPDHVDASLELALGRYDGGTADRLAAAGWILSDAQAATWDPWVYQDYIRGSAAEFSVAKHGYVTSRCGWFSERSAGYLASGRPVVVQDTGFEGILPTGAGLLAFDSPDEAAAAIDEVRARYADHSRAARDLAEECFDARRVLPHLIARITGASRRDGQT